MTLEEMKAAVAEELKAFKAGLEKGLSVEDMNAAIESKTADLSAKYETMATKSDFELLKTTIKELENGMSKQKTEKLMTVAEAILDVFETKGIKTFADIKKHAGEEIEFKADNEMTTASQTGTIMRTQEVSSVSFPRVRPTAFLGRSGLRVGTVTGGKSVILWTPASYTSNIGYVGEFAEAANGNQATAVEKTRPLAKLGGFQIITSETFADLPQFAQRTQMKLRESLELKLDELILSGDGDSDEENHIWGLKNGNMTAFDPTAIDKVEGANVSDLVDGCSTQAEIALYQTNTVWMHPRLANRLRRTKDKTGQYIINRLITGELVMGQHTVVVNTGLGINEMIVGDISAIQLWIKQNMEMEFERLASKDAWKMHIRMRAQTLVEDEDVKGLIYVADVAQALTLITQE